jgi:hypothetical protein
MHTWHIKQSRGMSLVVVNMQYQQQRKNRPLEGAISPQQHKSCIIPRCYAEFMALLAPATGGIQSP